MKSAKNVFITGASSGLGHGLALELAARGYNLALAARRAGSLAEIKQTLVAKYPSCRVELFTLDVQRYDDVAPALIAAAKALGGLDIVVANAGVGSTGPVGKGFFQSDRAVIETNVIGAMATLDAAVAQFRAQGHGHIVVISSVAAFRGLPGSASYSASKAAIAVYADAVRAELFGKQIKVTTLFPGFIDTPINRNMKSRPFVIGQEKGTRIIADLIERGVQTSTVPVFPWNLIGALVRVLPTSIVAKMR